MDTYLGSFRDTFKAKGLHGDLEGQRVDRLESLTSVGLESGSHEALREEEGGEPVRLGGTVVEPVANEVDSFKEVLVPGTEGFQGGVRDVIDRPVLGHLVVQECVKHVQSRSVLRVLSCL